MKAPGDQTAGGELAFLSALNRYVEKNVVISNYYIISCYFSKIIHHLFPRSGFEIILCFMVPIQPFLDKIHRVLLYLFIYMLPPLQVAVVDHMAKYRRIDIAPREFF
jgi:hypothetical protein